MIDFIDYYGIKRMGLSEKITDSELVKIKKASSLWQNIIAVSFLSGPMKQQYQDLLNNRLKRLSLI
jgi:serine/threonine-protein kinase HipA